jgi:hypothetical protein
MCWPRSSGFTALITARAVVGSVIAGGGGAGASTMIWTRWRSVNTVRSLLRESYPAALGAFGEQLAARPGLDPV